MLLAGIDVVYNGPAGSVTDRLRVLLAGIDVVYNGPAVSD